MKLIRVIFLCIVCLSSTWALDKLKAGLFNIVPYAYLHEGKITGITVDIIKNIEQESDLEIQTTLLPYKRMLNYLKSGQIDFGIFFLSNYSESFSDKLIPLYSLDTIIVGKKGLEIETYKDIQNLELATPLGVNYNAGLSEDKQLKITYVKDYKNAILMLKRDNIDALIGPRKILSYQLKQLNMNLSDLGTPYILTTNTAWIQFSHKSKLKRYKRQIINAAKILLEKNKIQEIILQYYPE